MAVRIEASICPGGRGVNHGMLLSCRAGAAEPNLWKPTIRMRAPFPEVTLLVFSDLLPGLAICFLGSEVFSLISLYYIDMEVFTAFLVSRLVWVVLASMVSGRASVPTASNSGRSELDRLIFHICFQLALLCLVDTLICRALKMPLGSLYLPKDSTWSICNLALVLAFLATHSITYGRDLIRNRTADTPKRDTRWIEACVYFWGYCVTMLAAGIGCCFLGPSIRSKIAVASAILATKVAIDLKIHFWKADDFCSVTRGDETAL